jgi:ATPase family associated with various cellular activities (AAA)
MTIVESLKAARKVSTPLVAILTPDPPATIAGIVKAYAGQATEPAILQHDIIRGLTALTEMGRRALAEIAPADDVLPGQAALTSPAEALAACDKLPKRALVFLHNAHRLIENEAVSQALCILRDSNKANGRTLVLLAPEITLPAELRQDVMILEEAFPTEGEIRAIIEREVKGAREMMKPAPEQPSEDTIVRAVEALSGLAAFPVEQSTAVSLLSGKLDPVELWARKRKVVAQTKGLSIDEGSGTFAEIGGLAQAIAFGRQLFTGRARPRAIVRIDEIEKMIGTGQDTSGVSQDALGTILREMEDQGWAGMIAVGPPGSGKSAYSKALGTTYGAPTFALDLGAAKGSLVGQSEERIRACMKVIKAVAADGAFFVATCNKLDALPPELRRRFRYGLWFFDLPSKDERAAIWALNRVKFAIDAADPTPADEGWTGAEIRNVAELSWRMGCSLSAASKFIVPVSVSDPVSIDKLRSTAHGKFLSASYEGPYVHAKAPNVPLSGVNKSAALGGRSYEDS